MCLAKEKLSSCGWERGEYLIIHFLHKTTNSQPEWSSSLIASNSFNPNKKTLDKCSQMHRLNRQTNNTFRLMQHFWIKTHWSSYLQISYFEGPDLLFVFNFPDFNQAAHVTCRHQGGVMAEHGTRHRVFVTCRDKRNLELLSCLKKWDALDNIKPHAILLALAFYYRYTLAFALGHFL